MRKYIKKEDAAFKNMKVLSDGKSECACACLRQVEPVLRQMFDCFDKDDFQDFLRCAWQVMENNKNVACTAKNKGVLMRNAHIIMAGLDVLDFGLRRRVYLLDKEITLATAQDVVLKRLEKTAEYDSISLPRQSYRVAKGVVDIKKVFKFSNILKRQAKRVQIARKQNRVSDQSGVFYSKQNLNGRIS